jgi:hypothetical protein
MSAMHKCLIWDKDATHLAQVGDGITQVRSWHTDGLYQITDAARAAVRHMPPKKKALLTTWIVDQHRSGVDAPLIDDALLDRVSAMRPLRISQRKQRFFLLAQSRDFQPSSVFKISGQHNETMFRDCGAISAWTECREDNDRGSLLRLLKEEGLVNYGGSDNVSLTGKGFEVLESLESRGAPTTQAFVAMWFDLAMDDAYRIGIEPAIVAAGYRPLRVDQKEHSNKIDDEIIAEIRRSRFVVADFTCEIINGDKGQIAVSRGGVYYEAGFAQGLGIPVIWTCRSDSINHVHFDTRQYNHIVWTDPNDLQHKLFNRIRAVIV